MERSTRARHERILVARVAAALVVGVMLGAVLDWLSTVSVGVGWLAAFLVVGGMFVWLRQLHRPNQCDSKAQEALAGKGVKPLG